MRQYTVQVGIAVLFCCSIAAKAGDATRIIPIKPAVATEAVGEDADDPALWIHPTDRARSLIIGTDKAEGPNGALYVFNLSGQIVQRVGGLNRPNNVDVRQGVRMNGRSVDLAVAAERRARQLRIFLIRPTAPHLTDITGSCRVFADETGDRSEPMGIALYHRPRDGALFAIVSRKNGPTQGYLAQYRLTMDAAGKVNAAEVRRFGTFGGGKEIESVCADDALGYVYYGDEGYGVRKYHADPNAANAGQELATFARTGYQGDHEGIAIIATGPRTGYIVSTEQIGGGSRYHLFPREGAPGSPHQHVEAAVFQGTADDTDGIEATHLPLGGAFPNGALVAMNSRGRNFLLFPLPRLPLTDSARARK